MLHASRGLRQQFVVWCGTGHEELSIITVVEIVYIEQIDWIDLDCSRKLSIVLNVSLLTFRHA